MLALQVALLLVRGLAALKDNYLGKSRDTSGSGFGACIVPKTPRWSRNARSAMMHHRGLGTTGPERPPRRFKSAQGTKMAITTVVVGGEPIKLPGFVCLYVDVCLCPYSRQIRQWCYFPQDLVTLVAAKLAKLNLATLLCTDGASTGPSCSPLQGQFTRLHLRSSVLSSYDERKYWPHLSSSPGRVGLYIF